MKRVLREDRPSNTSDGRKVRELISICVKEKKAAGRLKMM